MRISSDLRVTVGPDVTAKTVSFKNIIETYIIEPEVSIREQRGKASIVNVQLPKFIVGTTNISSLIHRNSISGTAKIFVPVYLLSGVTRICKHYSAFITGAFAIRNPLNIQPGFQSEPMQTLTTNEPVIDRVRFFQETQPGRSGIVVARSQVTNLGESSIHNTTRQTRIGRIRITITTQVTNLGESSIHTTNSHEQNGTATIQ